MPILNLFLELDCQAQKSILYTIFWFIVLVLTNILLCEGEAVTGELSKLLDEIKLCQEKDYSLEELCNTVSEHYLDNVSKVSEEEPVMNGSQAKHTIVSKMGCSSSSNHLYAYSYACILHMHNFLNRFCYNQGSWLYHKRYYY